MAHRGWPGAPGSLSSWPRLLRLSWLAKGSPPSPAPRQCALPQRPPFSLRSVGPDKLVSLLQGGASRLPLAAAVAAHDLGTKLELGPGAGPAVCPPSIPPRGRRGAGWPGLRLSYVALL
ncbi:hypothetical protein NN561_010248 [Cricetulus griseus]